MINDASHGKSHTKNVGGGLVFKLRGNGFLTLDKVNQDKRKFMCGARNLKVRKNVGVFTLMSYPCPRVPWGGPAKVAQWLFGVGGPRTCVSLCLFRMTWVRFLIKFGRNCPRVYKLWGFLGGV